MASGTISTEGRLEVYHNLVWGSIVDADWNITDATVACRQLGFLGAVKAYSKGEFGNGNGPVYMRDVKCLGTEITLLDCMYAVVTTNLDERQDVGVACESTGPGMYRE